MSVLRFTDEQLAAYNAAVQRKRGVGNVTIVDAKRIGPRLPDAPESDIQAAVLAFLAHHRRVAFAWRANTGAASYQGKDGKPRFVAYGFKGCADIIGMLRGGRFLAVECKRAGESPTAEQRAFLDHVNRHGGLAFVARSVDDVLLALRGTAA